MPQARVLATVVLVLAVLTPVMAEAPPAAEEDLKTTVEALKARNRDLERRLSELEARIGEGADAQRARREEVSMMIDQAMAEGKDKFAPGWLQDLKFGGDLRLRYEYRRRTNDVANGDNDERGRFRLRFGFEKAWPQEDLTVGFRLATGADTDPTSTNQTFGNMFQEYNIGVDRAYARWTPKAVKGLALTAGKMPNPWEATNLIWDTDVNPDGAWVEYRAPGLGKFEPFVGAGVFELFNSSTRPDANLTAYQAGLRYQITPTVKWTTAAQGFIYTNIDSAFANVAFFGANPRGNTVRGGRLAAGRFSEFDFVNKVDFVAFKQPWTVFTDWVHNTDNEFTSGRSDGFAVGVKVGQNKKKGDWSARYIWKRLEADATLAFFADSDFGWNTFTNRKGHEWGVEYNITDALTAGLTLFYTQPIASLNSEHFLTIQADLVWKF